MNLFCFSLEGSMDSLYEPVENVQETTRSHDTRAGSPHCTFTKMVSQERSYSMKKDLAASPIFGLPRQDVELSDVKATDANKIRKKSLIQKSISENEAIDRRTSISTHYLTSRRPDNDSYLRRHCPIEDLSEEDYLMGDRTTLLTRKKMEENLCQIPPYEQWNPPRNLGPAGNSNETQDVDDGKSESMGTLKRLQKIVRNKKVNDDVRHALLQSPTQDIEEEEEETLTTCMKLTKSQEKKVGKEAVRKKQEVELYMAQKCASLDRSMNLKWNPSRNMVPCPENPSYLFTDWKSFPDHFDTLIFSTSQIEEWENCICCNHQAQLPCSFTDTDLPYAWYIVTS